MDTDYTVVGVQLAYTPGCIPVWAIVKSTPSRLCLSVPSFCIASLDNQVPTFCPMKSQIWGFRAGVVSKPEHS